MNYYPPNQRPQPPPQYQLQYQPQYQPPQYYLPPPPNPWFKPVRRNANIVCTGLVLVFALGLFLSPVFTSLSDFFINSFNVISPSALSSIEMAGELMLSIIMLLVPLTIMRLWIGIPARVAFPMRRPRASIAWPAVMLCLGAAIVGSFISGMITVLTEALFGVAPYAPDLPTPIGVVAVIIYFLRLAVVPAIFEELIFRGVIMQSLRRFGDMFALVCSSILFSFAHFNLVQGPSTFVIGLFIGFFVMRTGSLRTGILIHFINNLIAVIIELVSTDLAVREMTVLNSALILIYIIAGIIGMILLASNHTGLFKLVPSDYPVAEGKKYSLFFLTAMPVVYAVIVVILTMMQFQ